ncbi:MAG TPA: rhomboid family intramembrane serine protease [Bryobacteraceae bacterium]|nr:rhomboid family intramembrane serine protease [Bryobacteraceae bacterium]
MIPLRDTQPSHSKPIVTGLIILFNVLAFFYEISLEPYTLNHFIMVHGLVPDRFEPVDLFTSMFLHGGWMHLIGNMWFLWIYGDNVEDILGHGKFLLFYILCGVAAGLVHLITNPYSRVPTVGASGAIAGVMGAYMVKFPHSRILTLVPVFVFLTTIEVPAVLILAYWFLIQIFSGVGTVATAANVSRGGVAWFAHVGGFIAGAVLVNLLGPRDRYRNRGDLRW